MARGMDAYTAHNGALQILNGQVNQQSSMLSFNDAWVFVLIVFVCVSPAILVLRRPKGRAATPAEAH